MNRLRFRLDGLSQHQRIYHGWAPSLPAGPATCPRRENGWEHTHSATPASPPALCLHSTVCKAKKWRITSGTNQDKSHQCNLTCMSWGGTSCLGSCAALWTRWRCGEPSQLSATSPKEPAHQNLKVFFYVHELLLGVKILIWRVNMIYY